jgi:hypothetical protein
MRDEAAPTRGAGGRLIGEDLVLRLGRQPALERDDLVFQKQFAFLEPVELLVFEDLTFFHSRYDRIEIVVLSAKLADSFFQRLHLCFGHSSLLYRGG